MALKSDNASCWEGNEKHNNSYISVVNVNAMSTLENSWAVKKIIIITQKCATYITQQLYS